MIVRNVRSRSNEMSAHHRVKSPLTISEMRNPTRVCTVADKNSAMTQLNLPPAVTD